MLRASVQDLSVRAPPSQGVGVEQTVTHEVTGDEECQVWMEGVWEAERVEPSGLEPQLS